MNIPSSSNKILLQKNWIKLILPNKKSLFYNKKEDTITLYPPFPKSHLNEFLQFYNLGITADTFTSLLQKATSTKPQVKEDFIITPIQNEKHLQSLESLSEYQGYERILCTAFVMKYNVNPSYQYSSKDPEEKQTCTIKMKNIIFTTGIECDNRLLAKENADKKGLRLLLPKDIYAKIEKKIEQKRKNEELMKIPTTPIKTINNENQYNNNKENKFIGQKRLSPILKEDNINDNDDNDGSYEEIFNLYTDQDEPLEVLAIDNRRITTEFLDSFSYKPMEMINIIKSHYPSLDVKITTSNNNSTTKIQNIPSKTTVRAEISSKMLNISSEANEDNKHTAQQICAQRFLKKAFEGVCKTWVELNEYFKKNKGMYLNHFRNLCKGK